MTATPTSPWSAILRLLGGALVIAAFSLGIFYYLMHPPMSDLGRMAQFLTITALVSGLAGYIAYRFGWMERSPGLRWTLLGGYALASLLTFFNVWLTARLMFASQHDLQLGTVLLVFAGGIAMVLGAFLSGTVSERLRRLDRAAGEIRAGNLSARVAVSGNDEVAALARTFNDMASRLQEAEQRQRELDTLRRDLVAWAGHDLRTPLTGIRVLIEALADGIITDPQTARRYLQQARKQTDTLALLVEDLFAVSQLDAGGLQLDIEPASLSDLVSDTLESFSTLATRQEVRLEGNVAPGVDPVVMDVQRVGRVLNNLVGNALRHTPAGGKVTVQAEPAGEGVRVCVSDTGEGIPPADLPHVFERFYRGEKSRSRQTGGAGLGLAIACGIVEAHGGRIGVESTPGQGAHFHFTLPRKN